MAPHPDVGPQSHMMVHGNSSAQQAAPVEPELPKKWYDSARQSVAVAFVMNMMRKPPPPDEAVAMKPMTDVEMADKVEKSDLHAKRGLLGELARTLQHALHINGHAQHGPPGEKPPPTACVSEHSNVSFTEELFASVADMSHSQAIERVKLHDVNGLLGRAHRSPITGQIYLKEVESWRDFHLVDLWTRKKLVGLPQEHAADTLLYKPRPLQMRTWIYHCKFRQAYEQSQIGLSTETFLFEALRARCVDIPTSAGLWSPAMVYAPLVPFTLLTDDFALFIFAAFIFPMVLLVSVATNHHRFYFWTRAITVLARLAFLVFVITRIQGGAFQLLGYLVTLFAVVGDLIRGDFAMASNMSLYCHYEIIRTLPNQIFVCWREGDHSVMKSQGERALIPGSVTGMQDPGDGTLCLIANIQGLLIELIPLDKDEDADKFNEEHTMRVSDPSLGRLMFYGVDLFSPAIKNLSDLEEMKRRTATPVQTLKHEPSSPGAGNKAPGSKPPSQSGPRGRKSPDLTVEDV